MTKCPICKAPATQKFGLKLFCGFEHAAQWAKAQADKSKAKKKKEFNAETRRRKVALKSRGDWLKEAQTVFNKYIRLRDAELPCVSCGRFHEGQWHAGHYLSVGSHPELRFNEFNVWRQCMPCNSHLSGNQVNYRIELINRIGLEKVEWLEGKHEPLKLTIDEIKALIVDYREKTKELEKK
jgi:ribosomal protein L44E